MVDLQQSPPAQPTATSPDVQPQPLPIGEKQLALSAATLGQLAAVLASDLAPEAIYAQVLGIMVSTGTKATIIAIVLKMILTHRAKSKMIKIGGGARRIVAGMESSYAAAYLWNATARISTAMRHGKTLEQAVAAERRNYQSHLRAMENRARAAQAIDQAARDNASMVLGWKAVLDARTTPECRAANGQNFHVGRMPVQGYPGMVHPRCRCKAVAAFPNGATLPSF